MLVPEPLVSQGRPTSWLTMMTDPVRFPQDITWTECEFCSRAFARRGRATHIHCAQCREPLELASRGYGWEDLVVELHITKDAARRFVLGKSR